MRKWVSFLLTVLIGLCLAWIAIMPPAPNGKDTPADKFSSARAMEDVRIIAAKPHPTGSAENEKVRAYIAQRMTDLGLEVSISEGKLEGVYLDRLNRWSGEAKTEQLIYNVIGVLPGQDRSKKALLLMAHHDTVWGSPGASDDTVGIASILEIVRALKLDDTRKRDIIVLITDAEELGLVGARQFFASHPLSDRIGAVINFEARGGGGTANMFQTSARNGQATKLYAKSVKQPSASSLSTFVYSVLPNDTDLTPALEKGYVAYNIANIGDARYYHSPKITADALSERTLQHMGSQGLDLSRALVTFDTLPQQQADAVFFDLFGLFTLHYTVIWGWVILAAAAIFYGLSVKSDIKPKEIMTGIARTVGFFLLGGLTLFILNLISGSGSSGYYDRLAAIPKLEGVAIFTGVSLFVLIFGGARLSSNTRLGVAIPIFVIAIIGQVFAPTASYFLTGTLLLWGLAAFMEGPKNSVIIITSALVFGYMIFLGHLLMLGVGPYMLPVAILPATLAALTLAPVLPEFSDKIKFSLSGLSLAAALILSLWIRFDPIAPTVPLY